MFAVEWRDGRSDRAFPDDHSRVPLADTAAGLAARPTMALDLAIKTMRLVSITNADAATCTEQTLETLRVGTLVVTAPPAPRPKVFDAPWQSCAQLTDPRASAVGRQRSI